MTCLQSLSVKLPLQALQVRSCPMRLRVRCPDSLEDHFPGDQKARSLENQTDRLPKGRACDFLVDLEGPSGRVHLLDETEAFLG